MNELTARAFIDLAISFIPEKTMNSYSDSFSNMVVIITQFIRKQIQYDVACQLFSKAFGTSAPIDRLQSIIDTSSDPIPSPEGGSDEDSNFRKKSRAWTQYEDQRLLAGIYRHGIENWTSISCFVGNGRTRSQCSQRWYRGLDPKISKTHWMKNEDDALISLVKLHGDKAWTQIATKIGSRSDVQCRYRYKQLLKEGALKNKETSKKASPPIVSPDQIPVEDVDNTEPLPISPPKSDDSVPGHPPKSYHGHLAAPPSFDGKLYSVY